MVEKTDEELMYADAGEWEFYNICVRGLPTQVGFNGNGIDKYGVPIPYGSSPHIARHFRKAIDIVKPKRVLEIGFNYGVGSALFLNLCDAKVISCDISDKDETTIAAKLLKEQFGCRFDFYFRKDLPTDKNKFDLIFIDGDHKEQSVIEDIELSKELNIPYILFDDCYKRFGDAMDAIALFIELELIHDMDNLKLYKWRKY